MRLLQIPGFRGRKRGSADEDLRLLRDAFDAEFYATHNDVASSAPSDLLAHFMNEGWALGLDPNRDFSTSFYLNANPDVTKGGMNPFLHFLKFGKTEGRLARPIETLVVATVDVVPMTDREVIAQDFDVEFYLETNPDIADSDEDPLDHFMSKGWRDGRDPTPEFSINDYLNANPDVTKGGMNPFLHFLKFGKTEGRPTRPIATTSFASASFVPMTDREVIAQDLDAEFYLETNPDIADGDEDLLDHFMSKGWRDGRDPTPEFSINDYLNANPDVRESGMNPFLHFLKFGKTEGRPTRPIATTSFASASFVPMTDREVIAQDFDAEFYLETNPDIADGDEDPLDHFMSRGWRDGCDPTRNFSINDYLEAHSDVAESGMNPFLHYLVRGIDEGRQTGPHPGGYKADILRSLQPLEEQVRRWIANNNPGEPTATVTASQLAATLSYRLVDDRRGILICIGHDDYRHVSGGVQFCIQREERDANKAGFVHFNLHPAFPLPRLAHAEDAPEMTVVLTLDGQRIGMAPISAVVDAFSSLDRTGLQSRMVIHSLLGHLPEQIADLAEAAGCDQAAFWLHDFLSLCPSFALQRNGVTFCGAPPPSSMACRLCVYGQERAAHLARVTALFNRLPMHVIAPSNSTRDLWLAKSGLAHITLSVMPHAMLESTDRDQPLPPREGPARIAFIGNPAPHKGWHLFADLAHRHGDAASARFFYFGLGEITSPRITAVPVHVTIDEPDAMIAALGEHEIDVVLHWASWPETFSFSTFEAIAAGAMVLTNPVSGNVAAAVDASGRGSVLPDAQALQDLFTDDGLDTLVHAGRDGHAAKSQRLVIDDIGTAEILKGVTQ